MMRRSRIEPVERDMFNRHRQQSLDVVEESALGGRHERHRVSRDAGPARAPHTVNVVLGD